MTMLETLGLILLVWIATAFAITINYYAWRFATCWRAGKCYSCWGSGGHMNWLLVFSQDSWEKCDKCNGTGKRK